MSDLKCVILRLFYVLIRICAYFDPLNSLHYSLWVQQLDHLLQGRLIGILEKLRMGKEDECRRAEIKDVFEMPTVQVKRVGAK